MIRAAKHNSIPAVAYYRMSSKKQDTSIPAKRVEVERYAEANGYDIVRWKPYVDEGISGSESEKREGFQRLMNDAATMNDFEVILCWDQDRFSRFDPLEANHYWYLLRQSGVRIVTVRQGELDLTELGGWLTASITQHGKAQYLKDLSANVLRGKLRKVEQGEWIGRPPYGYAVNAKRKLILGPEDRVATVRYVFDEYTSKDISLRQIAFELNRQGVAPPKAAKWTAITVQKLIRRETYKGQAAQFATSKGKFCTISGNRVAIASTKVEKPRDEWFMMDCPRIISEEQWDLAQSRLKRRQTRTTPILGGGRGLLNGILHCGHCGARMTSGAGSPRDSSGGVVYCCSTYNTQGLNGCNRNVIHQSSIMPYLVTKIQELVLTPRNRERLSAAVERKAKEQRKGRPVGPANLANRLAKLDRDIRQAAAECKRTPDDLYDLAVADLRELRESRATVVADIAAVEASVAIQTGSVESNVARAMHAAERLGEALTASEPAVVREALSRVCERIDVWFSHKQMKQTRSTFRKGIVRLFKPRESLPQVGRNLSRCRKSVKRSPIESLTTAKNTAHTKPSTTSATSAASAPKRWNACGLTCCRSNRRMSQPSNRTGLSSAG